MFDNIVKYSIGFSIIDFTLSKFNIKGTYYFNHVIANSLIISNIYNMLPLVYYDNLYDVSIYDSNVISYIFSIHFYHIFYYNTKLRYNDWLHHIMMIFVCLPLSFRIKNYPLFCHAVFFLTGLPGGIDYFLLFLNRNHIIDKNTEKRVNYHLNLWIRAPGCIVSSTLISRYFINNYRSYSYIDNLAAIGISGIVAWNGLYFMDLVLADYYQNVKKLK